MPEPGDHLYEMHSAMLRARAMGFEKTADALRLVLEELVANASARHDTEPPSQKMEVPRAG